MSATYSSRRSSLEKRIFNETSKSVPQTPAKKQHRPAFRTVPDTPKHNRLLSDDNSLDLEILTHKLQLYQLELEEASLRFEQRKMRTKEAEDVAAAARFLNKHEAERTDEGVSSSAYHARSVSFAPRTSSLRLPPPTMTKLNRSNRPNPLKLNATAVVKPQEIQSAALPIRREPLSRAEDDKMKRQWRRTTIAAGHASSSKIFLMTSPGNLAEFDFNTAAPPVPQLSTSASTSSSPAVLSPITPLALAAEDQMRRELETFALEEGPDLTRSRRSSVASRKRMPAALVPGLEDRVELQSPQRSDALTARIEQLTVEEPVMKTQPPLTRKKSIFGRFERKNEVDAILDLYATDDQSVEEQLSKKRSLKVRGQTFFRRFQNSEHGKTRKEGAG